MNLEDVASIQKSLVSLLSGKAVAKGLLDINMTGNVSERCADFYSEDFYKESKSDNPKGPLTGETRVVRGEAWGNDPGSVTTTKRSSAPPHIKFWLIGFRMAKDIE